MITKKILIALSIFFTLGSCVSQIKCMDKAGSSDAANRAKMTEWLKRTSHPVKVYNVAGEKVKAPTLAEVRAVATLEILNIDLMLQNMADPRGELRPEFTEDSAGLLVARRLNLGAMINCRGVVAEVRSVILENKKA